MEIKIILFYLYLHQHIKQKKEFLEHINPEQTYQNWEWVVVDDSPEDHTLTWQMLNHIASLDDRVKIYRIQPNSGGNVGEAKHRQQLCYVMVSGYLN